MRYGYFDDARREYVIERPDVPVSWTNYIGTESMVGVLNQTAGGYLFYESAEYHRMTRFRANALPMDRPGLYIYLRDDDTGEYWSISWQPVGKPLTEAKYSCRHGLSYSVFTCEYRDIKAEQTVFIPCGQDVALIDINIQNLSDKPRNISVFSYVEMSFHHIDIDNRNFQMSLYSSGARYHDGVIRQELHYEENGFQYITADFNPDGFDALRESFIGPYRTESNPLGVEKGALDGTFLDGGNPCGALHKRFFIQPNDAQRACVMIGEGGYDEALAARKKYWLPEERDKALHGLKAYWDKKLTALQVDTPSPAMNTMLNIWTLYQSEINVKFSRFASFIEVGGRTGLGYRDTAQDAMAVPHSNPRMCGLRIMQLLRALTSTGYGLHLFDPAWFEPQKKPGFVSPTVIPQPDANDIVHGLEHACSDDALWLVASIVEFIRETGDLTFADAEIAYADKGVDTVYDHLKTILDFSGHMVGSHGICMGLRADWNDCLNLGGGESALVSFLHIWALQHFVDLAKRLGRKEDAAHYNAMREKVIAVCEKELWDGEWYLRGFTKSGRPIGTHLDAEGRIHIESNAWAVLSGAASPERAKQCMDSLDKHLFTEWGIRINAPSYTRPDDDIGFVARVYPGLKENGSIFSHTNPWVWAALCNIGEGKRALRYYDALCPYHQNDKIETRLCEPYSYCQFITGPDHPRFGEAHHPFMTGSGGWSYFAATRFMLGIRPDFDALVIDPCIPADWDGFRVQRRFRGVEYDITVENPEHVQKGVREIYVNGEKADRIPALTQSGQCAVRVIMGN